MLAPADDAPGAPPVSVMSYRLWNQKFGADPAILGGVFNIDGKPFTVVGITAPVFFGDPLPSTPPDFYLPLSAEPLIHADTSLLHRPSAHRSEERRVGEECRSRRSP